MSVALGGGGSAGMSTLLSPTKAIERMEQTITAKLDKIGEEQVAQAKAVARLEDRTLRNEAGLANLKGAFEAERDRQRDDVAEIKNLLTAICLALPRARCETGRRR